MLVKNHLEYWRASLADAITQAPDDSDIEKGVTAGEWDIATGHVPAAAAADLWAAWRSANQKAADDDRPIPVLLMPLVLKPKVSSAMRRRGEREFYPVILIRACMDKAGRIVMPGDGMRPCISRDFLAPTQSELTVAEMDEVDDVYAVHPDKFKEWLPAIEFASRLEALAKWNTEQFVRLPDVQILASDAPIPAVHIVRLYDWMIKRGSEPDVLTRLLADPPLLNAIPSRFDTSLAKRHVGQMGSEYGLSESQRDTLNAVLADPTDSVLAINGPPGTGKTTLVQSVVASLWVKSASDGSECPLIVASSTNNQAVENVIEAFGRVKNREDDAEAAKLRDRWIPNVWSYGLVLPSEAAAKRAQQAGKNFQTYERKPTVNSSAVHFASAFADPAKWKAAAESFLAECTKHVVVQKTGVLLDQLSCARDALQAQVGAKIAQIGHLVDLFSRLAASDAVSVPDATLEVSSWRSQANACDLDAKAKRDRAQTVRDVLEAWLKHRADEPLMTLLLAFFRLSEKRVARDRVFLLGIAKRIDLPGLAEIKAPNEDRVVSVIDTVAAAADADAQTLELQAKGLRNEADAKAADLALWRGCWMPDHLNADELLTMLDTTQRHHAFLWATHYWEARFLLETHEIADGKVNETTYPPKLIAHFRRLAMLCPCFVSSLHMLPKWFSGYSNGDEEMLLGQIDLLIIDEAGQVAPEIASAPLALAKRALIVGDTMQLEPIWGLTRTTDQGSAIRHKLATDPASYGALAATGRLAASGSVMVMAQMASRYASYPDYERGMFLREHRRCLGQIIDYCNQLVYRGRLLPRTDEEKRPSLKDIPVMGYAHVAGIERQAGSSRVNDLEAQVIAKWLADKTPSIRAGYENKPIGSLIGVVTPFAAQAAAIKRELRKAGLGKENITVGTVHALQGAEREIVVFSPTYGHRPNGTMFFDRGRNMLNVTVSRAKDHFLVFGNMELFSGATSKPSGLLGASLFSSPGNEIRNVLPAVPSSVPASSVTALLTLGDHRRQLLEAITQARQMVCIVSPYVTRSAIDADDMCRVITAAGARGVQTLVALDEAFNSNREAEYRECIRLLEEAGAKVFVAKTGENGYPRLHSKLLWVDDAIFVTGSFNWLSAPRYTSGDKLEHSAVIRGEAYCRSMIRPALSSVGGVIPEIEVAMKRFDAS